jgi:hypothetical protein
MSVEFASFTNKFLYEDSAPVFMEPPELGNTRKRKRGTLSEKAKANLCRQCQSIDLKSVFIRNVPEKAGVHILHIGSIGTEMLSSTCVLCRLIATILHKFEGRDQAEGSDVQYALRLFSALNTIGNFINRRNVTALQKLTDTTVLGLAKLSTGDSQGSYTEDKETYRARTLENLGYIYTSVLPDRRGVAPITARVINTGKVDFNLAKEWLEFCYLHHKKTCTVQEHGHIEALRVIDCRTKMVTKAPQDCRYAAMSYVWGFQEKELGSSQHCEETGMLPSQLPQVIEDAIEVVIQLGFSFLWVDK